MPEKHSNATDHNVLSSQWMEVLDELNIGAFTVNLDHQLTAINYSGQALMRLQENDVTGLDCREIFTGVPCVAACVIQNGSPTTVDEGDVEVRDEDDVKHLITRFATPLYDKEGRIAGCLTILQDHSPITDLIDRLKYEEKTLKNILDSLDIGIFTINRGGLFTFFNKAAERISGYDRSDVLGRSCGEIFEGEAAHDVCLLKDAISDGSARSVRQGRMIDRDGVPVPIRANYMALRNEKGAIVGGLATFQDLTLMRQLDQAIRNQYTFHDMIGKSPAMRLIFEKVSVVARTDATVLIEGSTGTGKDLLARVIHSASRRTARPLVKVNCAAIPENLLESELFGYAKGAFTGADRDKPGRFQEAEKGTIFLDEIGDLSLALQAKLLRVLEDREFYPLGGRQTRKVDVRIISATNRRLDQLVSQKRFREDLYYRLNVFRIELPPLSERRGDLPLLIRHITRKLCAAAGRTVPGISRDAMNLLLNHPYPGNVRELENILEHALIVCREEPILPEHLPNDLRSLPQPDAVETAQHVQRTGASEERQQIRAVLERHQWHRGNAARTLGINRTTLWRKMKRYGILDAS